jgi:hypothetical protein
VVPWLETIRTTPTARSSGHGLGYIRLAARWDFTLAGHSRSLPGIALLAGVSAPTGTAPEQATNALATDSTGIGAWQGALGLAIEHSVAGYFFGFYQTIARRLPRTIDGVRSTLGTESITTLAAGYTFTNDFGFAWVATYDFEGDATIDGVSASGTGKALLSTGLVANYPITDSFRILGSLTVPIPISGLGKNRPSADSATVTLLYGWM